MAKLLCDRWCCAKLPESFGTDMQNVARENRQQRRRAAEDNRKQIDRNRAEQEAMTTDIGQAVNHLLQRLACLVERWRHDGAGVAQSLLQLGCHVVVEKPTTQLPPPRGSGWRTGWLVLTADIEERHHM